MADGRWPLADGRWPLAAGRWPMADGRCPLPAARCPLAAGRWPFHVKPAARFLQFARALIYPSDSAKFFASTPDWGIVTWPLARIMGGPNGDTMTATRDRTMIVYNPTTDRFELYATMRDTAPRNLRGIYRTMFAAWVALNHNRAATVRAAA